MNRRTLGLISLGALSMTLVGCSTSGSRTVQLSSGLRETNARSTTGMPLDQTGRVAYDRAGYAYGQGAGDALGIALHAQPTNASSGTRTTFVLERD
ncbi:MAG: hypothetical protein AAGI17_08555 [Planctomycetota bacterium]